MSAPSRRPSRIVREVAYAIRATWYCGNGSRCTRGYGPECYCAAISPDLRSWAGSLVRACVGSRCVTVRLIDCNCQAEHGIDLYAVAFRALAPLSVGELTVRLERL